MDPEMTPSEVSADLVRWGRSIALGIAADDAFVAECRRLRLDPERSLRAPLETLIRAQRTAPGTRTRQ